jgi:hypothetical protein
MRPPPNAWNEARDAGIWQLKPDIGTSTVGHAVLCPPLIANERVLSYSLLRRARSDARCLSRRSHLNRIVDKIVFNFY